MDFLECPNCRERYVVADATGHEKRNCRDCGSELRLVAEGLTGSGDQIEQALQARYIGPADQPAAD